MSNQNENKFKISEEKLTAFALGESSPSVTAEVQAYLKADPQAQKFVDEVKETATWLKSELDQESPPEVNPFLAQKVWNHARNNFQQEQQNSGKKSFWALWWVRGPALGLAMSFALILLLRPTILQNLQRLKTNSELADIRIETMNASAPQADAPHSQTSAYTEKAKEAPGRPPAAPPPAQDFPASGAATVDQSANAPADLANVSQPPAPSGMAMKRSNPVARRADYGADAKLEATEEAGKDRLAQKSVDNDRLLGAFSGAGKSAPKKGSQVESRGSAVGAGLGGMGKTVAMQSKKKVAEREAQAPGDDGFTEPAHGNTEEYDGLPENRFLKVGQAPLSTFSIDVDTASYSILRRYITSGQKPPADAVRIEEMINYFPYDYQAPKDNKPFAVTAEIGVAPWNPEHQLARIALKAREINADNRPATNLVFLVDVSGSMDEPNKLPYVKGALKMLAENMREQDKVSIVVYAGNSGIVLPPTSGRDRNTIIASLERLKAGGSTNGGQGIHLAYKVAKDAFIKGGNNRVILATDGDFNVGVTNHNLLTQLIQDKAKEGVFLSIMGFGMGNYKDNLMERLADKGNGNYAYIDDLNEARKVLVEQMAGTLYTVAKDVKLQIEFNPSVVGAYRLIGYENRKMKNADFNNDKKDAGDIGAGHTVTAIYELIPAGKEIPNQAGLRYQIASGGALDKSKVSKDEKGVAESKMAKSASTAPAAKPMALAKSDSQAARKAVGEISASAKTTDLNSETMTVKLRYKNPDADKSELFEVPVMNKPIPVANMSSDFRWTAAVAEFGMILRSSEYKGNATLESVLELAEKSKLRSNGVSDQYRLEFIELVKSSRKFSH